MSNINQLTGKPEIIIDYNKYKGKFCSFYFFLRNKYKTKSILKGGVDTFDHLVALNSCRRKTNRWPFNVFMFIVDAASQNAFSLFKIQNKEKIDLLRGFLRI